MTEVPNEHTHIVSIETFSAESLEGYKHPCVLKWATDMGYAGYLLRHPVTQEQSQGGAHGQIKLPHCIHPRPGDRSPAPRFPNSWSPYTQTCLSNQDTIDKYISCMDVKMGQIMAVYFCNP